MKKKRMGKRQALLWAKALWRCWERAKCDEEQRFYSRMVLGPAEALGCSIVGSYIEHSE